MQLEYIHSFLLILLFSFGLSSPIYNLSKENFYNDQIDLESFEVPDAEYKMHYFNKNEIMEIEAAAPRGSVVVTYTLYTRNNPTEGYLIPINNVEVLKTSNFNASNPTRFIIHGWLNSGSSPINELIRPALLARGNFNVFVVDWSSVSENLNYIWAKKEVPVVGKIVAEFIEFLYNFGDLKYNTLTLIGHSLGAHVCGFAGKKSKHGKINTIIGLDPAQPLFINAKFNERLDVSDASYVEIIHTSAGVLGYLTPIGDASFYVNWGNYQPGCGLDLLRTCSHSRSYKYYAESLYQQNEFLSEQCDSLSEIMIRKCKSLSIKDKMGGEPSHKNEVSGVFYVETNKYSPFAKQFETNEINLKEKNS